MKIQILLTLFWENWEILFLILIYLILPLSDTARFAGVAYAQDHFWFSASIFPDQKFIVKVNNEGNLVATYPQPSFFGDRWSAIATDGNYLL